MMQIDVVDGRMVIDNPDPNIPRCYQCMEPLTGLIVLPTKRDPENHVLEVKWTLSHHSEEISIEGLSSSFWPGRGRLPKVFAHLYVDFRTRDLIMLG